MNKYKLISFFLILGLSFHSNAQLTCSHNGAKVFYINGILTSRDNNSKDTSAVFDIFNNSNEFSKLDSNFVTLKKDDFIGIHNPSFGIINDAAELFAQQYYIKYGNNNRSKAIYYALRKAPNLLLKTASKFIPFPPAAIAVGMIPATEAINFASLKIIAEESGKTAFKNSMANIEELEADNLELIEKTKLIFNKEREDNKKMFIVAHSQGNAVLQATLKNIEMTDPKLDKYMKQYAGLMHVASPVIPKEQYKYNSIRYSGDLVIGPLGWLDFLIPLPPAPITHKIEKKSDKDPTGHLFFDTYLSNSIQVRKIASGELESSRQVLKDNMFNLATKLENNCAPPVTLLHVRGMPVSGVPSTDLIHKFTTYTPTTSTGSVEWNFGDGSPILTTQIGEEVTHQYNTIGSYKVTANVHFTQEDKISILKTVFTIDPVKKISILNSNYTFTSLMRKNSDGSLTYAGMFHDRNGIFALEGPVYTRVNVTTMDPVNDRYSVNCGEWTHQVENNFFTYCSRLLGQPASTTIQVSSKSQCGGEGCFPLPIGELIIPYLPEALTNPSVLEFTGDELPKP